MKKKKVKLTDVIADERLKDYEILVEAKGEDDYYDKLFLIAEIEKEYDRLGISKIRNKESCVERGRFLVKNFLKAIKKLKSSS